MRTHSIKLRLDGFSASSRIRIDVVEDSVQLLPEDHRPLINICERSQQCLWRLTSCQLADRPFVCLVDVVKVEKADPDRGPLAPLLFGSQVDLSALGCASCLQTESEG